MTPNPAEVARVEAETDRIRAEVSEAFNQSIGRLALASMVGSASQPAGSGSVTAICTLVGFRGSFEKLLDLPEGLRPFNLLGAKQDAPHFELRDY